MSLDPLNLDTFALVLAQADGPPSPNQVAEGTAGTQQSDPNSGGSNNNQAAPGGVGMEMFWMLLLGMIVFMFVTSIFGSRRQKRERAAMMSALSKHDRVVTNSGMLGTIVEIKEKEVVLRVDDETNTRITMVRDAVNSVVKTASD